MCDICQKATNAAEAISWILLIPTKYVREDAEEPVWLLPPPLSRFSSHRANSKNMSCGCKGVITGQMCFQRAEGAEGRRERCGGQEANKPSLKKETDMSDM